MQKHAKADKVKTRNLHDAHEHIDELTASQRSELEEDDDGSEESQPDNEGSPRGFKRARVSNDGSSRPSQSGRLNVTTLPRDTDG